MIEKDCRKAVQKSQIYFLLVSADAGQLWLSGSATVINRLRVRIQLVAVFFLFPRPLYNGVLPRDERTESQFLHQIFDNTKSSKFRSSCH